MREEIHPGRIVLLGPDSGVREAVCSSLKKAGPAGRELVCGQPADPVAPGDSVLLFGCYDPEEGAQAWSGFEELSEALEQVRKNRPRRVLFVSDLLVYGKVFGAPRLLREDEVGYVCHTAEDGMTAQCLRTAENLCARLAREEGLSVKIVRADWRRLIREEAEGISGQSGRRSLETILGVMLKILESGEPGSVCNLPVADPELLRRECAQSGQSRSPLMPLAVIPDTGKAEKYAAS